MSSSLRARLKGFQLGREANANECHVRVARRFVLVLVWAFALSEGLVKSNEAEKVQPRSISRKIEGNRKRRQQLDVEGFNAIQAMADPLLQLAMEISLVTLTVIACRNQPQCWTGNHWIFQYWEFRRGSAYSNCPRRRQTRQQARGSERDAPFGNPGI